jgi:probable phosphoglycerate mutase
MPGTLLVVRHGQSTWNAEHRWAGQADPPLSPTGRDQARALGRRLLHARRRPTALAASDLCRASETARIAGAELGLRVVTVDARLRERRVALSGLTSAEIDRRHPGLLAGWRNGVLRDLPGSSEPWPAFSRRVLAGLRDLARHDHDWLVVAHAGVFRVLEDACGTPRRSARAGDGTGPRVANTEGVRLALCGAVLRPVPP